MLAKYTDTNVKDYKEFKELFEIKENENLDAAVMPDEEKILYHLRERPLKYILIPMYGSIAGDYFKVVRII